MVRDPERVERLREQLADVRLQRQLDRAAVSEASDTPPPVAPGDADAGRGRDARPPAEPRPHWTEIGRHLR